MVKESEALKKFTLLLDQYKYKGTPSPDCPSEVPDKEPILNAQVNTPMFSRIIPHLYTNDVRTSTTNQPDLPNKQSLPPSSTSERRWKYTSFPMSIRTSKYFSSHPRQKSSIAKSKLGSYKRSAKTRGIVFEISDDYAIKLFFGNCFYCGKPPGAKLNGIDRINSARIDKDGRMLGYTDGNCKSSCSTCNYLKGTLSIDDFYKQCQQITQLKAENNNVSNFEIKEL